MDGNELEKAPRGIYDHTIVADITSFEGNADADLVVCKSTLEHVQCTLSAFHGLSTIVKPAGMLVIRVPSRNAVFARINLILPEEIKRKLLFTTFRHKRREHSGFPAYYDRCTPRDFRIMAELNGLEVEALETYFKSSYFSFFVPLYMLWRLWVLAFHRLAGEQAAETFVMVCRKRRPRIDRR